MKKIISILLLTFMCAMAFVGCGSGENTTTSSTLSQSSNEYENLTVGKEVDFEGKLSTVDGVFSGINNDNGSNVFDVDFGKNNGTAIITYAGANLNLKVGDTVRVKGTISKVYDSEDAPFIGVEATLVEKVSSGTASTSLFNSVSKSSSSISNTSGTDFNVDWDKCITNTKENSLLISSNYPYVKDVYIDVDDNEKEIIFMAILDDSTKPEIALEYADTMIRQLNMWARMQDESIANSTKDYYGGLYDVYSIRIGVAPLSQSQNQSKWFVSDYINKGLHTKHTLKLEKAYRR